MAASTARPGERIDIPTVPNLRDLGGYQTSDGGRVRTGQMYRSTALNHLAEADFDSFEALGVRTVFELRTASERSKEPDVLPPGTEQVVCDVLADQPGAGPTQIIKALGDPDLAQEMLGDGKAVSIFEDSYRSFVSMPSALTAYRDFFTKIAQSDYRPALFHCTTGKDRTGWAAAATLLLLGVSEDDVFYDFLLTNRDLLPAMEPLMEHFRAAGGDPKVIEPVLGVAPEYLRASLDELHTRFGSIEDYFGDGLGIDADGQAALREALREP